MKRTPARKAVPSRLRERWALRRAGAGRAGGALYVRRSTPRPDLVPRDAARALDLLREPELQCDGEGPSPFAARERERAELRRSADLATRVRSTFWYHTIELPGGTVTPGLFDHRILLPEYGLPETMAGSRVLDVATFDGFWAFEMERRGAQVTALDLACTDEIDLPPQARRQLAREGIAIATGAGFGLAAQALGSRVERRTGSVYTLDPATWGSFDLVHVGDLLLHLERPLEALRRIRSVTSGTLHLSDSYDPELPDGTVRYLGGWSGAVWWMPSLPALCQMVHDAGFASVEVLKSYRLDSADGQRGLWRAIIRARP